jgi:hypothetical protein
VAIAISMGAFVLLFATSGYSIDNGQVVQKGLVFFDSRPGGSKVYVEGIYNKEKPDVQTTDTRMELKEGRYRVSIQNEGYRDWNREFTVEGGRVERMVYPFLFPKQLETQELKSYKTTPSLMSLSPDRQTMVIQQPENPLRLDVYSAIEPERPATTVDMPASLFGGNKKAQKLEVIEWANDNQNILLKHSFGDVSEFIVFNREDPARSFNVNKLTNQNPYEVSLKDKKIEELFLHTTKNGLLQVFAVKDKTLTPLVSDALAYHSHGDDMLLYVTPSKVGKGLVSAFIQTKDNSYKLRDLPESNRYLLEGARFEGDWYIVAGSASADKVFIYKNPVDVLASDKPTASIFARTLLINDPQYVSFSANTRNLAVQSGATFAVYDAETDTQFKYKIDGSMDTKRQAKWMDGHRIVTSVDNKAYVFDFDGTNQNQLQSINPALGTLFDRDYDYAFSIQTNAQNKTASLQWTALTVSN